MTRLFRLPMDTSRIKLRPALADPYVAPGHSFPRLFYYPTWANGRLYLRLWSYKAQPGQLLAGFWALCLDPSPGREDFQRFTWNGTRNGHLGPVGVPGWWPKRQWDEPRRQLQQS